VEVTGESVRPGFIHSLSVFPNINGLSFREARLNPEDIKALAALSNVRGLDLQYVKFDRELLDALLALKNTESLRIRQANLSSIPDAERRITALRASLPNTRVIVLKD